MQELWPHQIQGVKDVLAAIDSGYRRIVLTSPTGGGKSVMIKLILLEFLVQRLQKAILYTNRKMLIDQLSKGLKASNIEHGIRSADHPDNRHLDLQIASIQTEQRREMKWPLHEAKIVVIDEAHLIVNGKFARKRIAEHMKHRAIILLVSATPIDIQDMADIMITAGTTSELRKCGALVLAHHFGPDEPDMRYVKPVKIGEDLSEQQNKKAIMVKGIFGRVHAKWMEHNPERRPTLLFAPGVDESIWFAEQFYNNGIGAAHIDGKYLWCNGRFEETSPTGREKILKWSREGKISVVCNRFVLREGIDMPWIEVGILATCITSLKSYIQVGGRMLRASPSTGKTCATIIDHGGNWLRHGSLNADRQWHLDWTSSMYTGIREDRLKTKKEKEPYRCRQCDRIIAGRVCPCGYEIPLGRQSRMVVQHDGKLIEYFGDAFNDKQKKISKDEAAMKLWEKCFWTAKRSKKGMTFRQAEAWFYQNSEDRSWPSRDLPLMPTNEIDFYRRVADVPYDRLIPAKRKETQSVSRQVQQDTQGEAQETGGRFVPVFPDD